MIGESIRYNFTSGFDIACLREASLHEIHHGLNDCVFSIDELSHQSSSVKIIPSKLMYGFQRTMVIP